MPSRASPFRRPSEDARPLVRSLPVMKEEATGAGDGSPDRIQGLFGEFSGAEAFWPPGLTFVKGERRTARVRQGRSDESIARPTRHPAGTFPASAPGSRR